MSLIPRFLLGDIDLTDYPYSIDRTPGGSVDFGNPETTYAAVSSLLRIGEIVRVERDGNRTLGVPVIVEGADMYELGANCEALMAELRKARNAFTVEPGDGLDAATFVFDTFEGRPQWQRDEDFEGAFIRRGVLVLPAYPHTRPATRSTATFTPGTSSPSVVDAASATTNWSSLVGSTLSVVTKNSENSLKVVKDAGGYGFAYTETIRWSGTVPATAYVAIDFDAESTVDSPTEAASVQSPTLNGVAPVSVTANGSWRRAYFATPAAGPLDFAFEVVQYNATAAVFWVGGLYSDTGSPVGSAMSVEVEGSMPTEGSLLLAATNLRYVCVYCDPQMLATGYNPATSTTWHLAPEGTYEVWMKGENYTGTTDLVAGDIIVVTVTAGGRTQTIRTRVDSATLTDYAPVGEVTLGGSRDGKVGTITVSATVNGASATTGAFRLFRKEPGVTSLLLVDPGASGTDEIRIDVPSLEFPQGGVWLENADGTDLVQSLEWPTLQPGRNALYITQWLGTAIAATLEYYPRSHTFTAGTA